MDVIIQKLADGENEQIIIRCHEVSPDLLSLVEKIKDRERTLGAYQDNVYHKVSSADVYYIEAVDNKIFIYCKNAVYASRERLYELEESLNKSTFFRVSKRIIVNLNKVKSVATAVNARLEATMENGEKIIISRFYVRELKKKLGI